MSRPTLQSTEWDFSVKQIDLLTPDGRKSGYYGNMREDTGEVLGTTSDCYGLVQNRDLFNRATDILAAKGLTGYTCKSLVTGNGQKFFTEFEFRNKQLANKVGDVFGYKLTVQNSFDRTLSASVVLGMLRLTCLNGASTLTKAFGDTKKHSLKVSLDFLDGAIDRAVAAGNDTMITYDRLADKAITDEQGKLILGNLVQRKVLSEKLKEDMETLWLNPRRNEDKPRNLWNLYNAVTEHLTHKVKNERWEYAEKTSVNTLFALDNAARKPDYMGLLLKPLPIEAKLTETNLAEDNSEVVVTA